jgi:integrase/recombinase XerC/integrase/recombinase XerD
MAEPTWTQLLERFTRFLKDEERSPHTIRNYQDDVSRFARWYYHERKRVPRLATLEKRDVLDWKAALEANGGRAGGRAELPTVNRKLAALRSFFHWAQSQGLGVRFDAPKPQKRHAPPDPRWLTAAEERALIAAVHGTYEAALAMARAQRQDTAALERRAQKVRDLAILYLGLHGGLRVAEMQALDWSDITINDRKSVLVVRNGKGAKRREVALSRTLRDALLALFELKALEGAEQSGPVLTGRRGRISISGLQDIAGRYGRIARVKKTVGIPGFSIHVLRHTCARRMLDLGVPIADVAAQLGHTDVKTTMGYVVSREETRARAAEALDRERKPVEECPFSDEDLATADRVWDQIGRDRRGGH